MMKWDLKLVTWPLLAIVVHVQVHVLSATRGHATNLRSRFVIRARHLWSIFWLRKENWPKKTFTAPLISHTLTYNYVKFIFPVDIPLKLSPGPVIQRIKVVDKSKWVPLNFGYHEVMCTGGVSQWWDQHPPLSTRSLDLCVCQVHL